MTTLEQALDYASRGWAVVPVHEVTEDKRCSCGQFSDYQTEPKHVTGKHPYPDGRYKAASTSPSQIHLWWQMYPQANVGIATGFRSKLIVLDVDAKNDGYKSLALLERQNSPLPKTVRAHSGGGGLHILFEAPRIEVRGRRGMRPGIDVMAEGGGFVAPPSKHKSGWNYRWDDELHPDLVKVAPLPRWLLIAIQTPRRPLARKKKVPSWL